MVEIGYKLVSVVSLVKLANGPESKHGECICTARSFRTPSDRSSCPVFDLCLGRPSALPFENSNVRQSGSKP